MPTGNGRCIATPRLQHQGSSIVGLRSWKTERAWRKRLIQVSESRQGDWRLDWFAGHDPSENPTSRQPSRTGDV